jgi:N-acetylmuramoyl-L-alanine amidase
MLAQTVLDHVIESTAAKSRGVKHGNFLVIRETEMPAILVEGGFLTNTSEMDRIKDPSYLKKLALGIAKGIQTYLQPIN